MGATDSAWLSEHVVVFPAGTGFVSFHFIETVDSWQLIEVARLWMGHTVPELVLKPLDNQSKDNMHTLFQRGFVASWLVCSSFNLQPNRFIPDFHDFMKSANPFFKFCRNVTWYQKAYQKRSNNVATIMYFE